jgi:hypothetical protein
MRANTWERIGKELKIKHKFYVSSRDVRVVCPPLKLGRRLSGPYCWYIIMIAKLVTTDPCRDQALVA